MEVIRNVLFFLFNRSDRSLFNRIFLTTLKGINRIPFMNHLSFETTTRLTVSTKVWVGPIKLSGPGYNLIQWALGTLRTYSGQDSFWNSLFIKGISTLQCKSDSKNTWYSYRVMVWFYTSLTSCGQCPQYIGPYR